MLWLRIYKKTREAISRFCTCFDNNICGKRDAHLENLRQEAQKWGIDYRLVLTDKPLDGALREYLAVRQGRM